MGNSDNPGGVFHAGSGGGMQINWDGGWSRSVAMGRREDVGLLSRSMKALA